MMECGQDVHMYCGHLSLDGVSLFGPVWTDPDIVNSSDFVRLGLENPARHLDLDSGPGP